MGWSGIVARFGDITFDEAWEDLLTDLGNTKDATKPDPDKIERAVHNVTRYLSFPNESVVYDVDPLIGWVLAFDNQNVPVLVCVMLRPSYNDQRYLEWMVRYDDLSVGPNINPDEKPPQTLVDQVPVREDQHEITFRERYDVWPTGYTR